MITTQRLVLRPWTLDDGAALYRHARNPQVGPSAGWPAHTTIADSHRAITDVLIAPEEYAITLRGEPIGSVGLHLPGEPELGYWIAAEHQGHGYATEAARAVLDRAFTQLGVEKVSANAAVDNVASQRVLEKLGFTYLRTAQRFLAPLGIHRESHYYVLRSTL